MNKPNNSEQPVFIGGHRRSGTTLFMALLDGHAQLSVFPPDSGFFYGYFPVYEDSKYDNQQRINRIIEFCYDNLRQQIAKVDPEKECDFPFEELQLRFREKAAQGNFTSKELLVAMISAYRGTLGEGAGDTKRWVEKTTSSEIYAKHIFDWFPKAQFIHILRDPRDNYASLKSGWEVRYKQHHSEPRQLLQSMIERGKLGMELARENLKRYGRKRYLIVKFEELIGNPKAELEKICNFLGIAYNHNLLKPTTLGRLWKGNNFKGQQFNGLSTANLGRWKERIIEHEAKVLEYYFRELMPYFGYQPHFDFNQCIDAAVEHYKWHNYAKD
ncbi:sulfotransferase [Candidatus Omnitrophota bacterium]